MVSNRKFSRRLVIIGLILTISTIVLLWLSPFFIMCDAKVCITVSPTAIKAENTSNVYYGKLLVGEYGISKIFPYLNFRLRVIPIWIPITSNN